MNKLLKHTGSLRVRFALGFGILATIFLAFVLIFTYASFSRFRKAEFYDRLRNNGLTVFKLLTEVEQIDHNLLKVIDKNKINSLHDEKVMIFNDTTLIYSSVDNRTITDIPRLTEEARKNGEYRTMQGKNQTVSLYMKQENKEYTILASAYDKYGRSELNFLKWAEIAVYVFGVIIAWASTYFFVKRLIHPLEKLKTDLTNVNYNNLDFRLPEKGQGEEVDSLSFTFNQMLARLQQSISFQKDFIHYASHELRTPLAAMVSLTEKSLNKSLSEKEAQQVLKELFQQQKNLTNITNSLLVLSNNNANSNELEYPKMRLDELLFRSIEIIKHIHPNSRIEVKLEGELSYEDSLMIHANEPLLLMAFNNLLKNGIQYSSDNRVKVILSVSGRGREVYILNAGTSFTEDEKDRIFTPFYRGSNAGTIKGYGLGLPLVRQIIHLHNATLSYSYTEGFNEFAIVFP